MSQIGAVVKVVDSHLCGWGSMPSKSCSFLIVSLSKGLSLCSMCSDQHVEYRMPRGFPLTSSLLLDYHVKKYTQNTCHTRPLTDETLSYLMLSRETEPPKDFLYHKPNLLTQMQINIGRLFNWDTGVKNNTNAEALFEQCSWISFY